MSLVIILAYFILFESRRRGTESRLLRLLLQNTIFDIMNYWLLSWFEDRFFFLYFEYVSFEGWFERTWWSVFLLLLFLLVFMIVLARSGHKWIGAFMEPLFVWNKGFWVRTFHYFRDYLVFKWISIVVMARRWRLTTVIAINKFSLNFCKERLIF